MEQFNKFNMSLDNKLVQINARVLAKSIKAKRGEDPNKAEDNKIIFGQNRDVPVSDDWTRALKEKTLFRVVHLTEWFVIVPRESRRDLDNFLNILRRTGHGMGVNVEVPQM